MQTLYASAPGAIAKAAQVLARGGLVAFPTETVYGLGADGLDPAAVARIFQAKGRPADHPVILHVADVHAARELCGFWPAVAEELAAAFWPGPLTLIVQKAAHVPLQVTGGQQTVGIRVPSHPVALDLLRQFAQSGSGVIAAPSANRFGAVSPTRAMDVVRSIGDRLGPDDLVLDGGECNVGVESTIVDVTSLAPRILRPGGIDRGQLERWIAPASAGCDRPLAFSQRPRVSGSLASHYAPRTELMLVDPDQLLSELRAAFSGASSPRLACLLMRPRTDLVADMVQKVLSADASQYARGLYAALYDLDGLGLDRIYVELPPDTPIWEAVRDRLARAATAPPGSGT